jgi:diacylglycerol kinase (ATP)
VAATEGAALAIVNPVAGSGWARSLWRRLEPGVRSGFPNLTVHHTGAPGDAERIAYEWGQENPIGTLLVAGGDGTLHQAVNGLFRSTSRAQLGVIPAGNGNDFARNAGISLDPWQATRGLPGSPGRSLDLGRISFQAGGQPAARVFLNSVSLGASVRANRLARSLPRLRPARLRYALAGLAAVLSEKPSRYLVTSGPTVLHDGAALNLTVANGGSFGGGMRISRDSSPADGILELVVLGPLSRFRVLQALFRLQAGTHLALRGVRVIPLGGPVRFTATAPTLLAEADGEELEIKGELTVGILPARLALLNAPS